MRVYLVVEWIDGIPETVKIYHVKTAAEQYAVTMGRKNLSVQEWKVD